MAKSQIEGSRMRDAFLGFLATLDPEPISNQNESTFEGIVKQLENGDTDIYKPTANQFLHEVALKLKHFFSHPLLK